MPNSMPSRVDAVEPYSAERGEACPDGAPAVGRKPTAEREDLVAAGHEVSVYTSNRCIRRSGRLEPEERWHGVRIRRFSRPELSQGGM